MGNLKWKLLGIYEDLYYYTLGLPRLLFTWKDDANLTMLNFFDKNVRSYPNDVALIFEGEELTWKQANDQVNNYAGFLSSQGVKKGDCFAMLMDNSSDFILLLLASFRIGSIAALINTTVAGDGLKHVISISNVKMITVGASHLKKLNKSLENSNLKDLPIFVIEDSEKFPVILKT